MIFLTRMNRTVRVHDSLFSDIKSIKTCDRRRSLRLPGMALLQGTSARSVKTRGPQTNLLEGQQLQMETPKIIATDTPGK